MTDKQLKHYRYLWSEARKVFRAEGLTSAQCEERRHEVQRQVLGKRMSSTQLTNRQFDLVKGAFLAISQPANLDAQMDAEAGDMIRTRHVVATLCAELGYDDDSLQSTIDRMQSEGRLREPERPRGRTAQEAWGIELSRAKVPRLTFSDLRPAELESLIIALRLQLDREKRQNDAVVAAPVFAF